MESSLAKRVFLSHKGEDKELIRDFKTTLEYIGYDPWLDEDAMPAGTSLERGLLRGVEESCAAVFFITPAFQDKGYLKSEIDYAIQRKRKMGDQFSIITLQFEEDGNKGEVPELLQQFVWKHPQTRLEALREIIRALPIKTGPVSWRDSIGVLADVVGDSTTTELSEEAAAILLAAVEDDGRVMHSRYMGGESLHAGRKSMISDPSPRTVAKWLGGLEDLLRRRFIKDLGHKGEVSEVTREGFSAADQLSK
ncbi:MAG: toll/interleukin-1 receptor domain-containing protein [Planctomycetota bacterium]